ncbi:MAG: ABC transporter ATP-binding protein [Bacteroidales bacterium]|jgi:ATP-binding cassette subfamily B protein|nr:ABC transporter ATP-binding protein [Bacteroidales bacterium]
MQLQKNSLRRALKLLTDSSGKETVLSVIILTIRAFLPLVAVILLRYYVDRITGVAGEPGVSSLSGIIWLIAAMALALLADDLLSYAGQYIARRHSYLLEGYISSLIHDHSSGLGLRFFEDPAFHDRLERAARDISWRPAAMVADLILLLRGIISFIAMGYVLRNFGLIPLAVLAFVFIPVLWIRVLNSSRLYETRKKATADTRQAAYFSWLLTGEKPAREVRLFDLGGYFERLFRKHFRASREPEIAAVRKNSIAESIASVVRVAAFAGVLVYATVSYMNSKITAGDLAMYLVAFRQALVYLRDAISGYSGLAENRLFLQDLFLFLDMKDDMAGEAIPPEAELFRDITVEGLSFTYPGARQPALDDISLRIEKGEKIAIVGPNGSGKTTLVKLLCRLYDPDSGCIRVNGVDVSNLHPVAYRKVFSVVFQNFMLYYLSAGDNIGLGSADGGADAGRVRSAAANAGINKILESLPTGYETQLGHHTEGGRELSWGEWQKLAIARAIYREAPVLILDEPASSLDADSEYEIFSDLGRITDRRTCIFISHRLSNVRDADRIIVLEHGRIAEEGSHDELMATGGRYSSMFNRQKSMYR